MSTFLAFGKEYVGWNYEKTGNPVYLHIKQTKKPVPEDRPSKKPTLLAIGMFLPVFDASALQCLRLYLMFLSIKLVHAAILQVAHRCFNDCDALKYFLHLVLLSVLCYFEQQWRVLSFSLACRC